ncbi:hypothetical protein [Lysinibacillus parviboronicapiens]|uniref:hypothetical protein n=1 Tax=Lysinibacillus parviboronicapiens TaxID=436516 RepID=UPI00187D5838|nr:hypothetical protein [Lysinibacillus parviboronicapiens]
MHNFCTLFDSNYLSRGMALYESLEKTGDNFLLYIICMDDLCFEILDDLSLQHAVLIPLASFESERLLSVKESRSKGEYCWTSTPYAISYVLDNYDVKECTYLDADLYFYNSPSILLDEFDKSRKSVLITEHRYTKEYDQSSTSGIYCVQFMTFKNNFEGKKILNWWQERCIEWCFNRYEDGKFGDQKYLDDWLTRFEGNVHVLEHLGGGVAPWNVQQYDLSKGIDTEESLIVFYHFHQFEIYINNRFEAGRYRLNKDIINAIYIPYLKSISSQNEKLKSYNLLESTVYDEKKDNNKEILLKWLEIKINQDKSVCSNFQYFNGKDIMLFGKNRITPLILNELEKANIRVQALIESNPQEVTTDDGVPIYGKCYLNDYKHDAIIIVCLEGSHDLNLIKELEELKVTKGRLLIISWKEIVEQFKGDLFIHKDQQTYSFIHFNSKE